MCSEFISRECHFIYDHARNRAASGPSGRVIESRNHFSEGPSTTGSPWSRRANHTTDQPLHTGFCVHCRNNSKIKHHGLKPFGTSWACATKLDKAIAAMLKPNERTRTVGIRFNRSQPQSRPVSRHLRGGWDWANACEIVSRSRIVFVVNIISILQLVKPVLLQPMMVCSRERLRPNKSCRCSSCEESRLSSVGGQHCSGRPVPTSWRKHPPRTPHTSLGDICVPHGR